MNKEDITVYPLKELYDRGFIENIRNFYLRNKEDLVKDYPFISSYDDETMSVYASYYIHAIANRTEEYARITRFVDFNSPSDEDIIKIQEYYRDSLIEWIRCLYEIDINTDEKERSRFKSYKLTLINQFIENDYTKKFMKLCYNPVFEKAVKTFLCNNYLELEKLDMSTDGDNYFNNALMCLYIMLSMDYLDDYKDNKRKLAKAFKQVEYEEAMDITTNYFEALNDLLYNEEEFMQERALRVNAASEVKKISDEQIKELKQNPEYVRRLTPQKNNE